MFGDERFLSAAVRCGEVVWERGILRKGCGLCHGTAGNAFAFLQLYGITGNPVYVARAVKVGAVELDGTGFDTHTLSLTISASISHSLLNTV